MTIKFIRYVLDGNALGSTATEAFHRRPPVVPDQPDSIVVSIGYPLVDAPYSPQRYVDFIPPTLDGSIPSQPGVASGANEFIDFIDKTLRPFVQTTVFPNTTFTRDALYGHSGGGVFVLYVLLTRPELFDTFLAASPFLAWNDRYLLNHTLDYANLRSHASKHANTTKPAFAISYGSLEQYPVKRRTETQERYQYRLDLFTSFAMTDTCKAFFELVKNGSWVRDKLLREYVGSDHAALGGAALADGIDYFTDW